LGRGSGEEDTKRENVREKESQKTNRGREGGSDIATQRKCVCAFVFIYLYVHLIGISV